MALHQIIYTSCRRGIDGVNDGQQVYSYDRGLTEEQKEAARPYFGYTQPRLPAGTVMTEEVARTLPQSFTYNPASNGQCIVALNTYLGRDYMGEGGRFGNALAHVIVMDEAELTEYPCDFIGTPSLRSAMAYEEVNNPDKPDYLETPTLEPGAEVNIDDVTSFLQDDEDNLFIFKRMLQAMLRCKQEQKRLVICDTPERLRIWIGALNYTLPLELARQIGFTTYAADPALANTMICGVLPEGTSYTPAQYCESGAFYVFDFINEAATQDEFEEPPYISFVENAYSYYYESLQRFNTFVIKNTNYRGTDTDLYKCYDLYMLATRGVSEVNEERFSGVTAFAEQYCNKGMIQKVCSSIMGVKSRLGEFSNTYILSMFRFLLRHFNEMNEEMQASIRQLIIDHIMQMLQDPSISQEDYGTFYTTVDEMARSIGLSVPAALVTGDRKDELNRIMGQGLPGWKFHQIIGVFCAYVKDCHLPASCLTADGDPGSLFAHIIEVFSKSSKARGVEVARRMTENFADNSTYYVTMALAAEHALQEANVSGADMDGLWSSFADTVGQYNAADTQIVEEQLTAVHQYDNLYRMHRIRMQRARNLEAKNREFMDLYNVSFKRNTEYAAQYSLRAIEDYADEVMNYQPANEQEDNVQYDIYLSLAELCMSEGITGAVTDQLVNRIVDRVSLERPNRNERHFLDKALQFYEETAQRPISGRLLVLYSWSVLDRYERRGQFQEFVDEIRRVAGDGAIDLQGLDDKERKKYLSRIIAWPADRLPETERLISYYRVFALDEDANEAFMTGIRKAYYHKERGQLDYALYADYLEFLTECGSNDDIEAAGAALCALKPEQLNDIAFELDKLIKKASVKETWEHIRRKAGSTSSIAHAFGSVFGKIRKNM